MLKCNKGYTVKVLRSNAGYYIGTVAEDDGFCPNCRVSVEYYKTAEEAQKALDSKRFTSRSYSMENQFCGCTI